MRNLLRTWRHWRFHYEPLIEIAISRDAILHNLQQFQAAQPGVAVAPVLKSNAYGHGLVPIAKILAAAPTPPPFLCVDSYMEALILRNEGVRVPLLVIGYTPLTNIERRRLRDVAFAATSIEELRRLAKATRKPIAIHLKIDTGMHRQGIGLHELSEAMAIIRAYPQITLQGIYSHLADAETPGSTITTAQIERWNAAVREARTALPSIRYFHLSNTAGRAHRDHIDANAMRLGIGLYGITASADRPLALRPALAMSTRITSVRKLLPGESVGYNATFTAEREMAIATIPVGYAEGLDRRLSNVGAVTIGDVACPIVGRVSMNMSSIDVSRVPAVKMDDGVLVVSAETDAPNSIQNMAAQCGTIPYELLIHFPAQIRRVIR